MRAADRKLELVLFIELSLLARLVYRAPPTVFANPIETPFLVGKKTQGHILTLPMPSLPLFTRLKFIVQAQLARSQMHRHFTSNQLFKALLDIFLRFV